MKKQILFLFLFLFSFILDAQNANFEWAKHVGGSDFDAAEQVSVDASGNSYTTGYFRDVVDFDPDPSVSYFLTANTQDIFILKLDPDGHFLWAKQIVSATFPTYSSGRHIEVDAFGNVYTTGFFSGTADFDPGAGIFYLTSLAGNDDDVFVLKLDTAGNFIWAKKFGGLQNDQGMSITVDPFGNVYTTGYFASDTVDFDPGIGVFNLTGNNNSANLAGFVSKLDATGNFVWAMKFNSNFLFSTTMAAGYDITTDLLGNVLITGSFSDTVDFDPGIATYNLISYNIGASDIFILKLNAAGNFVWAKNIGGLSNDVGYAIVCDTASNVYISCTFYDITDFDPGIGTFFMGSIGSGGTAILKLDAAGNFVFVKGIMSNGVIGWDITLDSTANIYVAGFWDADTLDFDPGPATYHLTNLGQADAFILKLDKVGNFVWVKQMRGTLYGYGNGISIGPAGDVYTSGFFKGDCDFDPGVGMYNLTSIGGHDLFVHKMCQSYPMAFATISDTVICVNQSTTFDGSNSVGANSFLWSFPGGSPSTSTSAVVAVVYAVAGNYSATLVVSNTCGDDSLITVQIAVGCIGIEPFTITEAQVFFNQNIGSLIFSFPPDGARYNLIIYDQLGQVVKTFSTQESSFQWDVTDLSSGVYFIETEGAKGKKVTRVVK